MNNVGSNWSSEHSWQRQLGGGLLAGGGNNGNLRTGHVEYDEEKRRKEVVGKIFVFFFLPRTGVFARVVT